MSLSTTTRERITALRTRYPHPRSAVLPSLWAVQDEIGWLSPEGMGEVATLLDLAPSEVQAVSTFYSMYFKRPQGEHHVLVCVNAPCALRGADDIVTHLEERLGCPSGGTTADGRFTWEATIECLGGCGYAPMMQIDHHFHEHLTPERVDAVLEEVARSGGRHGAHPSAGGGTPVGAAAAREGGVLTAGTRAKPPAPTGSTVTAAPAGSGTAENTSQERVPDSLEPSADPQRGSTVPPRKRGGRGRRGGGGASSPRLPLGDLPGAGDTGGGSDRTAG